jgi:hypothetical protein
MAWRRRCSAFGTSSAAIALGTVGLWPMCSISTSATSPNMVMSL